MKLTTVAALAFAAVASAMPTNGLADKTLSTRTADCDCDRACMKDIVNQILESMVAKNPRTLPMAQVYQASENSHPASLSMMTSWRTVTKAGPPSLLAIDTTTGSAYFSLDISEGSDVTQSVFSARVKVVNKRITELEIYINRSRGDHGFSLSPEELPTTFAPWMSPPADRQVANRSTLEELSAATFNRDTGFNVTLADTCQFSEEGWRVVDPGPDLNGSYAELGCAWPDTRPVDLNARLNLVVDEELGIVVTGALVNGVVWPYGNLSAFIPNDIVPAQEAQAQWFAAAKANDTYAGLVAPSNATGSCLQVLQYYDNALYGQQIMVYLSGPYGGSIWESQ